MFKSAVIFLTTLILIACGGSSDTPAASDATASAAVTLEARATATSVVATPVFSPSVYVEPPPTPPFSPAKAGSSDTDVTYCKVGGIDLKLDIFYPQTPATQKYPLIVFIHGGRLIDGSKLGVIGPMAGINGPAYTARGYAFASLDYRLAPESKLPAQIEDVKCAIRYLRTRATSYNIDSDRIGVIGLSSGGYLVAMLGLADSSAGFEGRGAFEGVSSKVQAVVSEYPQITFELPSFSKAETDSRAAAVPANASPQFLHSMSLPTYVSRSVPPFLFFHGEFDALLSPIYTRDLHNKLVAAGADSTYVLVKAAGHGWLSTSARLPGTPHGPIPTAQEILTQELAFFDKHLKE